MKERQILFSGSMVRALLDGRKGQTRRVVKGIALDWLVPGMFTPEYVARNCRCPYGQLGDRLWVRETFVAFGRWETRFSQKKGRDEWHFVDMTLETGREYRFDGALPNARRDSVTPTWWKRPAIFMPRAASRIALEVTGVRVERLQGISEDDALAEGCNPRDINPVGWYAELWDSLNAERGFGWETNPWVWVVEFRRISE